MAIIYAPNLLQVHSVIALLFLVFGALRKVRGGREFWSLLPLACRRLPSHGILRKLREKMMAFSFYSMRCGRPSPPAFILQFCRHASCIPVQSIEKTLVSPPMAFINRAALLFWQEHGKM